jgi:hypothetical protein
MGLDIQDIVDTTAAVVTGGTSLIPGVSEGVTEAIGDISGRTAATEARNVSKAQKEAIRQQQRMQEVEAQRARIAQQREARIRRAQVISSSTTMGAGTSGTSGAVSSIGSQMASNIGGIGVTQGFAAAASEANQQAADASSRIAESQARAQGYKLAFDVGSTIFGGAGGFTTIFGGNKFKPAKTQ